MLSFIPRDVLDEILGLIESVSEGIPTHSLKVTVKMSRIFLKSITNPEGGPTGRQLRNSVISVILGVGLGSVL